MTQEALPAGQESVFHTSASKRARIVHRLAPLTLKPLLTHGSLASPVLMSFRAVDRVVGLLPPSRKLKRTSVKTSTWHAQMFEPEASSTDHAIVYFHGGAYVSGGLGTHRRIAEELALSNRCVVLNVAYRHYPRTNFEGTVADGLEAVTWLISQGFSASAITLMGDSAGGGLAMRVAGDLLKLGVRVEAVVGLSAWLDFDATPKQIHHWKKSDAYIPADRLEEVARLILGREPRPEDSPITSLSPGFPPLLMICGATEILRVDTDKALSLARALGVACEAHYFEGGVHAFPVAVDLFPESMKALELIQTFLAKQRIKAIQS